VTFEGGEGTGKSTQVALLARHLEARGRRVVTSREPGGTPLAVAVRAILLDPALAPDGLSEYFLLAAARRDHVRHLVAPALAEGAVVLLDRFSDSSVVYQGFVRGVGEERVAALDREATGGLAPDLTVVLDLDPATSLARAHARNRAQGGASRLDDEPAAFHARVREGFLRLAARQPERVRVVAADGASDEVHRRVLAVLPAELG
jgi:dTMP kinase